MLQQQGLQLQRVQAQRRLKEQLLQARQLQGLRQHQRLPPPTPLSLL
jgi:hypothetical protein